GPTHATTERAVGARASLLVLFDGARARVTPARRQGATAWRVLSSARRRVRRRRHRGRGGAQSSRGRRVFLSPPNAGVAGTHWRPALPAGETYNIASGVSCAGAGKARSIAARSCSDRLHPAPPAF